MTINAYAYVRFSSKLQEEGDSLNRQLKSARSYAAEHGLLLDESYHDLGVSAFKGLNVIDGNLGRFIAAVESGIVPHGSYLLVESMDRISRNVITEAQQLFLRIINLDITIVTLMDRQVFSKEKINQDGGISMMLSLMYMLRAHEESQTKSQRVAAGWEAVRNGTNKDARQIITRMCPAWLSVVDDAFVVNESRAKVIKQIFELALQNNGTPSIARKLNAAGTETFREGGNWSSGTVAHVLSNKAVIGILETKKIPAREDYFPVIIDPKVFWTVQQAMRSRNFVPGPKKNFGIANLFSGMSFCGQCGSRMKTVSQAGKNVYLRCTSAYSGSGCDAPRVAYRPFEAECIEGLVKLAKLDVFKSKDGVSVDPRPALREQLEEKGRAIEKLLDVITVAPKSASLINRLTKLEQEQADLQKELDSSIPPVSDDGDMSNDLSEQFQHYLSLAEDAPERTEIRKSMQLSLRRFIKRVNFHIRPNDETKMFFSMVLTSGQKVKLAVGLRKRINFPIGSNSELKKALEVQLKG